MGLTDNLEIEAQKMVERIAQNKEDEIFKQFNKNHNLRLVTSDSCKNCKNLMEDIVYGGGTSFYTCPLQGEDSGNILIHNLICDKWECAIDKPKKTERRKNTKNFLENMQSVSNKTSRKPILSAGEIDCLMGATE